MFQCIEIVLVSETSLSPPPPLLPPWLTTSSSKSNTSFHQKISCNLHRLITPHHSIRTSPLPLFFRNPLMANLEHKNSSPVTHAYSLKAAIFHKMAVILSLEINNDKITPSTKKAFLKVLYIVCRIKKKNIFFEKHARIHMEGHKIAVCETASDSVFVMNTSFTSNATYVHHALAEVREAFNATMLDFGYTRKLEPYNPTQQQVTPPQKHPFYG